jgi:hypothetical protein
MVIVCKVRSAATEDSGTDADAFAEEMDMTAAFLEMSHLEERTAFVTLRTAAVAVVAP